MLNSKSAENWEARVFKCPLPDCDYKPRARTVKQKQNLLFGHIYTVHKKHDIVKAILILAGLEDIEEAS